MDPREGAGEAMKVRTRWTYGYFKDDTFEEVVEVEDGLDEDAMQEAVMEEIQEEGNAALTPVKSEFPGDPVEEFLSFTIVDGATPATIPSTETPVVVNPAAKAELIERYGEPDDLADVGEPGGNRRRAKWGWVAIEAFMRSVYPTSGGYERSSFADSDTGVMEEVVGDLICDLMHFIILCGAEPDVIIGYGQRHFEAEAGLGYEEENANDDTE
jgi:hypothetical protein